MGQVGQVGHGISTAQHPPQQFIIHEYIVVPQDKTLSVAPTGDLWGYAPTPPFHISLNILEMVRASITYWVRALT